jgi:hypothetical protein
MADHSSHPPLHTRPQANLQHGEGTYTGPVFSYTGEYRSGLMHGSGKLTFKSGNKYEGEFANDKMHGRGTFTGMLRVPCVPALM